MIVDINFSKVERFALYVLILLALAAVLYLYTLYPELKIRTWFNTPLDVAVGVTVMVLCLEAARRSFGLLVPIMAIVVVLHPFLGHHLPEPFYSTVYSVKRTLSNLSLTFRTGLYDAALSASANYIFLFVVFGGLLQSVGATGFFLQLAKVVGSKFKGGPGMMAVVSSAGVGSITGSVVANMTITGSFTIPLMKQVGYKPEQAGAIEAAASNGGQILPPVMGITAFAMAGVTGIPYIKICAMAVLPALLYFLNCGAYVQLQALKQKISFADEKVDLRELLLTAPIILVPFALIVVLFVMGYSVMFVAFWAIVSIIATSLVRKKTRPSFGTIIEGFVNGGLPGMNQRRKKMGGKGFLEGFIPYGEAVIEEYVAKGAWINLTYGDLLDRTCDRYPDNIAVIDDKGRLTYQELREKVQRFAIALIELGVKPHDRIIIQLPNRYEFVVAFYGMQKIGAAPILAVPRHGQREISQFFRLTDAAGWIVPVKEGKIAFTPLVQEIGAEFECLRHLIMIEDGEALPPQARSMEALIRDVEMESYEEGYLDQFRPDPNDVAVLLPTGGTTGLPKRYPAPTTASS